MIPLNQPDLGPAEEAAVLDALQSGWVTGGAYVTKFEEAFCRLTGRRHAVACSSGTMALWVAAKALGLRIPREHEPEVDFLVSGAYTCDAVANVAVSVIGRPPSVLPVEEDTWGLSIDALARWLPGIGRDWKGAVVLAHIYGVPARDTVAIRALCRAQGVPLIEDCSEAHGAMLDGKPVGSFGEIAVFSCRGEKLVSGGQLGVALTDDDALSRRMRQYAESGLPSHRVRYWSTVPGLNAQAGNLHAALACAQLERLPELIKARVERHEGWRQRLAELPGIEFQKPHGFPVWWLTAIVIGPEFTHMRVHDLAAGLGEAGVDTRPGFYPLYMLPHAASGMVEPCPVSERLLDRALILPSGAGVGEAEQDFVVAEMLRLVGRA